MHIGPPNIQLAMMSPAIAIPDKVALAKALSDITQGLFDGEPMIFPLPPDAPPEFPRLVLKSKDERYSVSISSCRVDFFCNNSGQSGQVEIASHNLFSTLVAMYGVVKTATQAHITRCAEVWTWPITLDSALPSKQMLANYLADAVPFADAVEVQLHCRTLVTAAGLEANKWTRIVSTHSQVGAADKNVVSLLVDINTLADKAYAFDETLLKRFLEEACSDACETLTRHETLLEDTR